MKNGCRVGSENMDSDTLVVVLCILLFILGFLINDKIHAVREKEKKHEERNVEACKT